MANWEYKEKYITSEYSGDYEEEIVVYWNTTSDSGVFLMYPGHIDPEEAKKVGLRFDLDSIDSIIKILEKIKEDHG